MRLCILKCGSELNKDPSSKKNKENVDDDPVQKSIGTMGRWQIWIVLAISMVKFPMGWHILCFIVEAPPVQFVCEDLVSDKCAENCTKHLFDKSIFSETIVTEYDLVCEKEALVGLTQSLTMLGIMVGNFIFGIMADKYGRRGPLAWSVTLQAIAGTASAFVPWFWPFVVLRFVDAVATGGTMTTSFVLVMEVVGRKQRSAIGTLYQFPFVLAHLSLAGFSYFLRDWRQIQVAISLPTILLISYYWILPESPKWLISTGKTEEAIKLLEKAAKINKRPTESIRQYVMKQTEQPKDTKQANILDLFKTPKIRCRIILSSINWGISGFVFYGAAQYIGAISQGYDFFENIAISAAVQIPAIPLVIFTMKIIGRKLTLIISMTTGGISFILVGILNQPEFLPKILTMIVISCAGMSFCTNYVHSSELFPTTIRNIGVGICSVSARVGSMLAPFAITLHEKAPICFGVAFLAAAFGTVFLPETANCKLPDTVQEIEGESQRIKDENYQDSKYVLNPNSFY